MIGALLQDICDMEYIAVLNNYLEDSLDDRHTGNSSLSLLTEAGSKFFSVFSSVSSCL